MAEDQVELECFLQWAASVGISDSPISATPVPAMTLMPVCRCLGNSLSISHFPEAGGRGLASTRDLRKGELILRVPKEALLTSHCLRASDEKLDDALRKYSALCPTQILAISVLNEVDKGTSSCWYPYLKQLPRSYQLLSHFGQFEIEALQIDDAVWTAKKAVGRNKMEWEEARSVLCELNLKPQFLTYKAWLWASATISSRTMHVPWDTAGCLCPVGDFFNYAPPEEDSAECLPGGPNTANSDRLTDAGFDEKTNSYCFYARRNYDKGDQVLLCYGTYTNMELLEYYGFILDANPNDKVFIPLEPDIFSLCPWPRESLYISQDGKPSFSLLATLRLWATPVGRRKHVKQFAYSGNLLNSDNESIVMESITRKCRILLSKCSTSVDEDEAQLLVMDKVEYCPTSKKSRPPCLAEIQANLDTNVDVAGTRNQQLSIVSFRMELRDREKERESLLLEKIQEHLPDSDVADEWVWRAYKTGSFTASSAYNLIEDGDRVPSADNLLKRGVEISASHRRGVWCATTDETINHLFFERPQAQEAWIEIYRWLNCTAVQGNSPLDHFSQHMNLVQGNGSQETWKAIWASNSLAFMER